MMTEDDIKAIADADEKTLAEWWCELNRWGWPEALGTPESPDPECAGATRRDLIMFSISDRIGMKECLREWNKDTLPGQAFDEWWGGRGK